MGTTTTTLSTRRSAISIRSHPLRGLATLVVVAAVAALLGIAPGAQTSLEVVFPIATYALVFILATALWWGGAPFAKSGRLPGGVANLIVIVAGGLITTGIGMAIVGGFSLDAMFSTQLKSPEGVLVSFPWSVPLAVCAFAVMMQITFVCEKRPFSSLKPAIAGWTALVVSWIGGLVMYLVLTNWDLVPADFRALVGLNNTSGPIFALDLVAILVCIIVWQLTTMFLLGGWPFSTIASTGTRLFVANVTTIGGGVISYILLHDAVHWTVPMIIGVGGSAVASVIILALVFETWPFATEEPSAGRLGLVVTMIAVTAIVFWILQAIGSGLTFDRDPRELWTGAVALDFVAAVAIVYCMLFGRWPIPAADDA
jgi:hypothetical protein